MPSIKSKVESLLFISNQPLTVKKLVKSTKAEKEKVEQAIRELSSEYKEKQGGILIQKIGDKVQMATTDDNSKLVKDYIKEETTGDLSKPAIETLTIIAYRGPVSRAELEQIRGVNCAIILRNLLIRGLIEQKQDSKKMQMIYNITFDFLKFLGLSQQSELPDYDKLNSSESLEKILDQNKLEDKN